MAEGKSIGALNGPWSVLLRVALATYPLVLAWCVWVTVQQFEDIAFRGRGDRFTNVQGLELEQRMLERFAALPPQDWRDRIVAIERNQTFILEKLARIETKLDSLPK